MWYILFFHKLNVKWSLEKKEPSLPTDLLVLPCVPPHVTKFPVCSLWIIPCWLSHQHLKVTETSLLILCAVSRNIHNAIFYKFLVLVYQSSIICETNWFLASITKQPQLKCIVYDPVSIFSFSMNKAGLTFLWKFRVSVPTRSMVCSVCIRILSYCSQSGSGCWHELWDFRCMVRTIAPILVSKDLLSVFPVQ